MVRKEEFQFSSIIYQKLHLGNFEIEIDTASMERPSGRPERPNDEESSFEDFFAPEGPSPLLGTAQRPSGRPGRQLGRPERPNRGPPNLIRPGRPGRPQGRPGLNRPGRPQGRPERPRGRPGGPGGRPGRPGRPFGSYGGYDRFNGPRESLQIPNKKRRPEFGQRFVPDKQRPIRGNWLKKRPPAPVSRSLEEDLEESQEFPEDIDEELSTEDYSGENSSTEAADSEYSNEDDISIEDSKIENSDNFYE